MPQYVVAGYLPDDFGPSQAVFAGSMLAVPPNRGTRVPGLA